MLTKKYSERFLEVYDAENNKGKIIKNIIETEEESEVELLDWDDAEVATFLKKASTPSPQTLNKHMVVLRKFADFICKKKKIAKRKYVMQDGVFMQLINKEQLMSVTIDYDQYMIIKNQLDITSLDDGSKINLRDKVIFELAWEGLTSEEIKLVKENDIEFIPSDNGEVTIIETDGGKIVRIEDPEVSNDIKLCLKEKCNTVTDINSISKTMVYKESEYLIKPIKVGRTSSKTHLDNPHLALHHVLKANGFTCPGIDMDRLTLADIRRSRLIYLLAPENSQFFNFENVASLFNLKRSESLRWFKEIAAEKYESAK